MRNKLADHNSDMISASRKLRKLFRRKRSGFCTRRRNRIKYMYRIIYLRSGRSVRDNNRINKCG